MDCLIIDTTVYYLNPSYFWTLFSVLSISNPFKKNLALQLFVQRFCQKSSNRITCEREKDTAATTKIYILSVFYLPHCPSKQIYENKIKKKNITYNFDSTA